MSKTKQKDTDLKDEHDDEAINELADLVVTNIKEEYQNDLEPFEVYAQKIRSQLHSNIGEFRQRFIKGYLALMEEIHNKSH